MRTLTNEAWTRQEIKLSNIEMEMATVDLVKYAEEKSNKEFANFIENRIPVKVKTDPISGDVTITREAFIFTAKDLKEILSKFMVANDSEKYGMLNALKRD